MYLKNRVYPEKMRNSKKRLGKKTVIRKNQTHRQKLLDVAPEALIQQKFQDEAIALTHCLPPELVKLVSQDAQALAIHTVKCVG